MKFQRKKNHLKIFLAFAALSLAFVFRFSLAQSPREINISAYLVNGENKEITNGEYEIRFALYAVDRETADPYPSNSDPRIWEETQKVKIQDGFLNAYLGAVNPIPESVSFSKNSYYVGIRIGTDSEMFPRKRIGSVPVSVDTFSVQGQVPGTEEGNILVLDRGGKINIKQLPTGTGNNQLVLGNDDRLTQKELSVSGNYNYLSVSDHQITLSQIDLATDVSGILSLSGGGTGVGSYLQGDMLFYNSGNSLSRLGIGNENQVLTVTGGVPVWADSVAAVSYWSLSGSNLYPNDLGYNIGIGTNSPTRILGLGGNANRNIGMERGTVAGTAGYNLTLNAGGATVGSIDKNGGNLYLSSGISTGTGTSDIYFQVAQKTSSGSIKTFSVSPTNGGNGYVAGEILNVTTGGVGGQLRISSVNIWGSVTAIDAVPVGGGAGYSLGSGKLTSGGSGTGCTVEILEISNSNDNSLFTRMSILGSGNVGIDTTAPQAKLDISSITEQFRLSYDNSDYVSFSVNSTGDISMIPSGGTGGFRIIGVDSGEPIIVGGMLSNSVTGQGSFIGNGTLNDVSGVESFIGTGNGNTVSGRYSFIGSGYNNRIIYSTSSYSGEGSFIGSGNNNVINGAQSYIGSGNANVVDGTYSYIGAGWNNYVSGWSSAIFGGASNVVSGSYSGIIGGLENVAGSNYTVAGGRKARALNQGTFAFSDSQNSNFDVNVDDAFGMRFAGGYWLTGGNVGIGITSPSQKLSVFGDASFSSNIFGQGGIYGVPGTDISGISDAWLGSKWTDTGDIGLILKSPNGQLSDYFQISTSSGDGDVLVVNSLGNLGIGITAPTAKLHLGIGTTIPGTAPLKFTPGLNLANTEAGAVEFDGSHLYFTVSDGGIRFQLDQQAGTSYDAGRDLDLTGVTFDIESQLDYVSTISRDSSNLTLQTTTSGTLALISAGSLNFTAGAASSFNLVNSTVNAFDIESGLLSFDTSNSRVGIGTTSPGALLELGQVSGSGSKAFNFSTVNSTAATSVYGIYGQITGTSDGSGIATSYGWYNNINMPATGSSRTRTYGRYDNITFDSPGVSNQYYGTYLNFSSYKSSAGTAGNASAYGQYLTGSIDSTAARASRLVGVGNDITVANDNSTYDWGGGIGMENKLKTTDDALRQRIVGMQTTLETDNLDDGYGIFVEDYNEFGDGFSTGGNQYGVYIKLDDADVTNWGIYEAGGATNYFSGNVGIGTTAPTTNLEVTGQIKITGGTPGANKVLTSDAAGLATWEALSSLPVGNADTVDNYHVSGSAGFLARYSDSTNLGYSSLIYDNLTNVGIGTTNPLEMLHVVDNIFTEDNLYVGARIETMSNAGFSLDGDDLFVSGMAGIEGNVYTDGSFIAGASTTISNGSITQSSGETLTMGTTSANLTLQTTTSGNIILNPAGNVGIGTTDPGSYKLYVNGSMALTGGLYDISSSIGLSGDYLQSTGAGTQWITPYVPTREVWLSPRSDGKAGKGTINDPYDASTQTKFDAIISGLGTTPVVIHLLSGTYNTNGVIMYSGWQIIGAGMERTVVNYVKDESVTAVFSSFLVGDDTASYMKVSDLTIDGGAEDGDIRNIAAVILRGKDNNLIEKVRAVNMSAPSTENFILRIDGSGAWNNYGNAIRDSVVENCYGTGCSAITIAHAINGYYNYNSVVERNRVSGSFIGFTAWNTKGLVVRDNYFEDVAYGLNFDSGVNDTATLIYGNTVNASSYGLVIGGGGPFDRFVIENNNFIVESVGIRFQGNVTNAIVRKNKIEGTGTIAIQASGVGNSGFVLENNNIDGGMSVDSLSTAYAFNNDGSALFASNTTVIDSLGNIGVGITNPTGKLIIKGAGTTNGIGFQTQNLSGTALVTMLDSGNVGIGTTNSGAKLDIETIAAGDQRLLTLRVPNTAGNNAQINFAVNNSGSNIDIARISSVYVSAGHAGLAFSDYDTGSNLIAEVMRIIDGNVGIGTTAPGAKLEVTGQIKITGGTPGANKVLTSDAAGLATWEALSSLPVGNADTVDNYHVSGSTGFLARYSDSTNLGYSSLVYDNLTNVGIGTTNPSAKLEIAGNIFINSTRPEIQLLTSGSGKTRVAQFSANTGYFSQNLYYDGSNWNMDDISQNGAVLDIASTIPFRLRYASSGSNPKTLTEFMRFNSSGYMGLGTTNPNAIFHIVGTNGVIQISDNENNSTTKIGRVTINNYNNSEEPVYVFGSSSTSTDNNLAIGGGGSNYNAATNIQLFTASNNNTLVGTLRMFVSSSGNVGIGTTNPLEMLHVVDNIFTEDNLYVGARSETMSNTGFSLDGDDLFVSGMAGIEGNVYTDGSFIAGASTTISNGSISQSSGETLTVGTTAANLTLSTTTSGNIILNPTGNVGIGTTNPGANLDLYGGGLRIQRSSNQPYVKFTYDSSDVSQIRGVNGGGLRISSGDDATPWILINSNSRVGIGTTSPAAKLDVLGASGTNDPLAKFSSSGATDSNSIYLSNGTGSFSFFISGDEDNFMPGTVAGDGGVRVESSKSMFFGDSGSTRMILTSAGRIGIGTTNPLEMLHVVDNIFTEDNLYVGARSETMSNTGFSLDGDDLFVAGMAGIEGNVYTDGSFIAGASTTISNGSISQSSGETLTVGTTAANLTLSTTTSGNIILNPTGNVGIGTTNPTAKLDIYGDIIISKNNSYLNFGSVSGTNGYGLRDDSGFLKYKNSGGEWASLLSGDLRGYKSGMEITKKDDDEIYVSAGTIEINSNVYKLSSQISKSSLDELTYNWDSNNLGIHTNLSNGNLTLTHDSTSNHSGTRMVDGVSSGKYYWEIKVDVGSYPSSTTGVGIATSAFNPNESVYPLNQGWYYGADGNKCGEEVCQSFGYTWTTGDIVNVALDMDSGKVWFGKNGVWQNWGDTPDPSAGTYPAYDELSGTIYPSTVLYDVDYQITANFGDSDFSYSIPSGFEPLHSFSSQTYQYVYADIPSSGDSLSVSDIDISTTSPVWDSEQGAYYKSGDTTERLIGKFSLYGGYVETQSIYQEKNNFYIPGTAETLAALDLTNKFKTSQIIPTLIGGDVANNVLTLQGNSVPSGNFDTNPNIQFKVGNSGNNKAMTILNNGNVGIGTTAPLYPLSVNGNSEFTGNIYPGENNSYSLGSSALIWDKIYTNEIYGNNVLLLGSVDDAAHIYINSSGNVGVGNTNPGARLSVQTSGTTDILNLFEAGGNEVMTVLESGDVGIGTTNPGYKFEVVDTAGDWETSYITNYGTSTNEHPPVLTLMHRSSNSVEDLFGADLVFRIYDDNQGESVPMGSISGQRDGSYNYGSLVFSSGYQNGIIERMRIKPTGEIGIGVTNPGTKLQVDGTITPGSSDQDLGTGSLRWDLYANQISADSNVYFTGLSTGAGDYPVKINNSTGEILRDTSSRRYKDNVVSYSVGINNIMNLRPVTFTWNSKTATPGKADFGLIAEEVNEFFPELVIRDKNGIIDGVRYDKLPIVLLQGMKEQQNSIISLGSISRQNNESIYSLDLKLSEKYSILTGKLDSMKNQIENDPFKLEVLGLEDKVGELEKRLALLETGKEASQPSSQERMMEFYEFENLDYVTSGLSNISIESGIFSGEYDQEEYFSEINIKRTAINLSSYDISSGYLSYNIYVEDAGALIDLVTELGNEMDYREIEWKKEDHPPIVSGWNQVRLKISQGSSTGQVDWSKLDYMRIYFKFSNKSEIKLSDIKIEADEIIDNYKVAYDQNELFGQLIEKSVHQEALNSQIQTQLEDIKKQTEANSNLLLAMDPESMVYKDALGNVDLLQGKLEAEGVVAGAFTVKTINEEKKTIGEATIVPISKDENNDGKDDETENDGKSVLVKTKAVSESSKIFTSFESNPNAHNWVDKIKEEDGSYSGFRVMLDIPVSSDVKVNWWIVESE